MLHSSHTQNSSAQPHYLDGLHDEAVRDLAWSLYSPPLLTQLPGADIASRSRVTINHLQASAQDLIQLQALDKNPAPLHNYLQQFSSTRLGVYFEVLWRFYLNGLLNGNQQMVAHNLQVHQQGLTVGELDFIYRDTAHTKLIHAEAAVKFYLGAAQQANVVAPTELHQWLGPNASDSLGLKLEHMLRRQLPLADTPAAADVVTAACKNANITDAIAKLPLTQELLLRGRLFYPFQITMQPPAGVNPDHNRGDWCYRSQLADYLCAQNPNNPWQVLSRQRWLAPVLFPQDKSQLLQTNNIVTHLRQHHYPRSATVPLLLAEFTNKIESKRLFVMADSWPELN